MAFDFLRRIGQAVNNAIFARAAARQSFKVEVAVSDTMERHIDKWYRMYTDKPEWVNDDVYALGLPQAISREFARVVSSEMNIKIDGSKRADYLQEQIEMYVDKISDNIEVGVALGGLALKPYVYGDKVKYIGLDVVSATAFIPVRFDDGGYCVSGIFRSKPVCVGSNWYVRMEYHDFSDGQYKITNKAFHSSENGEVSKEARLADVPAWVGILPEVTINDVERPLFGYFSCPSVNMVSASSSVGCSVYAGATEDLIREADMQWWRFRWEYDSAERKIIGTPNSISGYLPGGVRNPLEHDRLFVQMAYDSEEFFKEFSPALRDSGYYDGLQEILRRIEFNVGLSYGDLSDPSTVEKTAQEIKTSKNRKYNTVNNIEKRLTTAIKNAVYGMDVYCTLYNLAPRGEYDLQITFDDSILEDSETERARDLQEIASGLMAAYEYRMKWYNEDEETAKAAINSIKSEQDGNGLELMFNA